VQDRSGAAPRCRSSCRSRRRLPAARRRPRRTDHPIRTRQVGSRSGNMRPWHRTGRPGMRDLRHAPCAATLGQSTSLRPPVLSASTRSSTQSRVLPKKRAVSCPPAVPGVNRCRCPRPAVILPVGLAPTPTARDRPVVLPSSERTIQGPCHDRESRCQHRHFADAGLYSSRKSVRTSGEARKSCVIEASSAYTTSRSIVPMLERAVSRAT
jgi:hypothetical protein